MHSTFPHSMFLATRLRSPAIQNTLTKSKMSLTVHLTNPDTVAFYNEFYNDPLEAALNIESIIDTHVSIIRKHLRATDDQLENNEIMQHIRNLEQSIQTKNSAQFASISSQIAASTDSTKSQIKDISQSLVQNIESLTMSNQSQMITLINTVDTAIRNSLEKIDVDVFSATISKTIKDHLSLDFTRLAQGQTSIESSITSLESKLKQELTLAQQPSQARHDQLMSTLTNLPSHISSMYTTATLQQDANAKKTLVPLIASLQDKLQRMELDHQSANSQSKASSVSLSKSLSSVSKEVDRMWKDILSNNAAQKQAITTAISHTPSLIQNMISTLATSIETQSIHTNTTREQISSIQMSNEETKLRLSTLASSTNTKLQEILTQLSRQSTQSAKGKHGEDKLYTLLSERLTSREDYSVSLVSGFAHNCDINVKRIGYPDIRVESKAIGEHTNEKVRTCEVEKFRKDLLSTDSHGIFVSLYGGIVGKGLFGIEQLPNGKFAVYLSNNNFDIDTLHDMIIMLYHLDKHTCDGNGDVRSDLIKISPDTMQKCSAQLIGFGQRIATAKTHLKETIVLLNEITLEKIEQILIGHNTVEKQTPPPQPQSSHTQSSQDDNFKCEQCNKLLKTAKGLVLHKSKLGHW